MSGSPHGRALIALGTNLPFEERAGPALLGAAVTALTSRWRLLALSSAWESPAWPPSDQGDFTNACASFAVDEAPPEAVLAALVATEAAFGRVRGERWAARTLDLDLIDMEGRILAAPDLELPHPRAHERAFVLAPLAEIAPDWRHPVLARSAASLLNDLPAPWPVRRIGALRDWVSP